MYGIFTLLQKAAMVDKMLVICPLKPAYNVWPKQQKTWDEFKHLRVCVLHGKDKESLLLSNDYDIYVVNPEGLGWLFGAASGNKPSAAPSSKRYTWPNMSSSPVGLSVPVRMYLRLKMPTQ